MKRIRHEKSNTQICTELYTKVEKFTAYLWTFTVVKRGLQKILGSRFVFSGSKLCKTYAIKNIHNNYYYILPQVLYLLGNFIQSPQVQVEEVKESQREKATTDTCRNWILLLLLLLWNCGAVSVGKWDTKSWCNFHREEIMRMTLQALAFVRVNRGIVGCLLI